MADSARRSGRATKGQHTRNLEAEEAPTPPPKRGGKASKSKKNEPTPPPEEEENAIIRCICGCVEEDEDDERKMICCEKCEAWQHNECMEVSENDDELPEKYYCEQCRPKDHKELLAKIARGEKPWEERARERERKEQEKKGRKKGKKGKKAARASEVPKQEPQENGQQNGAMEVEPTETKVEERSEPVQTPPVIESAKRKLPEEPIPEAKSPSQAEPASKQRKISSPATMKPSLPPPSRRKSSAPVVTKRESTGPGIQAELVGSIDELQGEDRKNAANALKKMFVDQTKQAEKQGSFKLPQGQSVDAFGLRLGLQVEYAIYFNYFGSLPTGKPSEPYKDKFRAILHNVKANPSLRDRLLNGSLSPDELSKMSRDDMASKELQEKKAEMMKEAEKQHFLIQEEGPRMRRTHKGEELVEDESHIADGTESAFAAPVRKRMSEIDIAAPKQESPEVATPHSPAAVELPESFGAGSPANTQPLTIDTSGPPSAGPERKSSSNFNIQDVFSGVKAQTPTSRPSEPAVPAVSQPQAQGVQADAEIDQLLKDEEPEDEEPYSPTDYAAEPGSHVWHGTMSMTGIASFDGKAKHVAGANLSSTLPWPQLIPSSLIIEGRIDVDRATEYLCGLRWSQTTDVVVVSITPNEDSESQAQFEKLFKYFTERKRYGVVAKSPVPAVRDIYVAPLEAGMSKKPDFVELLEYCSIEDPTPERMLLLTFVVKSNNSPSAQQTPRHLDAALIASPIGANASHGPNALGQHPGFQNSPTPAMPFPPPSHLPPYAGSPTQAQHTYMPPHNQQHQSPYSPQQQHNGPIGMDAARQALGDLINSPVVAELLEEAPGTGVPEFAVVKQLMENVPAARDNLSMLKGLLEMRHKEGQVQGQ